MKTKRKSILLTIALCLLLALTSLLTVPFSRARAEVKVADLVTGGTAFEVPVVTPTGSVSYVTQAVTDGKETSYSGAMYATTSGSETLDLGTVDLTGITAEKPLISFLPYFSVASAGTTAPFGDFYIDFTSGEKSVTVKSFMRSDSKNVGLAAGANGQTLRAWSWYATKEDTAASSSTATACESRPFTWAGVRGRNDTYYYVDGTSGNQNDALIQPIKIYFGENASGSYTVYTDIAMHNESNKEEFVTSGGTIKRYKIADLEGYTSAPWTPFTEDEMQNVKVTLRFEGVTAESKMLITELNGKAIEESDVANYSVKVGNIYGIEPTQGIAKTITEDNKTITVANKMVLGDNDVFSPLAKIALFPEEAKSGSSAPAAAESDYFSSAVTEWPKADEEGKYWKTATAESEYNAIVTNWQSKFKSDIEALYLNFTAEDKTMSVKLAYRGANDASGQASFKAKTSAQTDELYYGRMITNGALISSNATNAGSGVRFDGLVVAKTTCGDGSVIAQGGYTDPVYSIYYDAETNALYSDTGIMGSSYVAPTNFGTEQDPVYRWMILDLDGTTLPHFEKWGDEKVTMTVTADLRDKDGDGDLTDESANIMIMTVDGQDLTNDGTDVTATPVEAISAYGYEKVVYGEVGKNHAGQTIKTYTFLSGEEEHDYTQYDMEVTGPDGEVTVDGGRFAMTKSGEYAVTVKMSSRKMAEYTVKAGAKVATANAIAKFSEQNETADGTVTDISYGALPSYMKFAGAGINVTQTNIKSDVPVTAEPGGWLVMQQNDEDVQLGVKFEGIDVNASSSLIKVAFPGVNEGWGRNNGAYSHGLKIIDPVSGRWIHLWMIADHAESCDIKVKAIGSWEVMGYANLIREAGWDDSGEIKTPWKYLSGIDADADGTITPEEIIAKKDQIGWSVAKTVTNTRANARANTPIEIKFDNENGLLYFINNGVEVLVRDFKNTSTACVDYKAGEVAYPSGNEKDAVLTGKFAENGIVDIQFGIDASNKRNKNATTGEYALEHRYTIMSLGGVDLSEVEAGYLMDTSPVREVVYTGPEYMLKKAGEQANLTFSAVKTLGASEVAHGKIKVDGAGGVILAERDYVDNGNLFYSEDVPYGDVTVTYTGELTKAATVRIVPVLTANAGANGAIKVDGEVPTEYDATGSYEITVEPNAHYEVDTFTVGGVDKKAELVDGAYAYDGTGASGDVAIEVTFRAITYTITYDLAGGTVEHTNPVSYSVEIADITLVAPTSATKTGHTFAGWSVETIDTSVGGNVTVTATWAKISYVVTFEPNGGAPLIASGAEYDTLATKPADPTKEGFAFGGWYKDEALTTAWDFATDKVTDHVTIYAKWLNVYTVSFTDGVAVQNVVVGAKATEPTAPTKTGYTFGGWYNGETAYDFNSAVTGNVALTAKWTINTYNVTFEVNGGSAVTATTANYDTLVTKPTDPTKEGYTFAGWYKEEALTNAWNFETDKVTADVKLYAKWTEVVEEPTPDTTPDTTPDAPKEEKKGCGKEAVGLLAIVLSALAVVFVSKRK